MPDSIKIRKVHSCSDQSKKYPATNLLDSNDPSLTWRCHRWCDYCWIILELDRQTMVNSITIINDQSAFVEVFGGGEGPTDNDNLRLKVLLPVFSSMSPSESRERLNGNRKYVFNSQQLTCARNEPCRYIKCVCWQPYNKDIKFGLANIKITGAEYTKETQLADGNCSRSPYGKFKLIDTKIVNENFFTTRYDSEDKKQLLAIREEKPVVDSNSNIDEEKNDSSMVAEKDTAVTSATKIRKAKIPETDPLLPRPSSSSEPKRVIKTNNGIIKEKNWDVKNATGENTKPKQQNQNEKVNESRRRKQEKIKKPFEKLMSHVVFVLSGYENPLRSNLKNKALEMGAKYEPKWNTHCTHLVCAFADTPKYNEANRKGGRIVNHQWIEESYVQRRCLPWRKYVVGKYTGPDTSSESADDDEPKMKINKKEEKSHTKILDKTRPLTDYDSDFIYGLTTDDEN